MENRYATKKTGKTEVYPFWNLEDIHKMIEYFKANNDWDNYLIFMLGLLLGRRIGDTVMVKWSDFYYENGKQKDVISTIKEQKTGKTTSLPVGKYVFQCIDKYCEQMNIVPLEHYDEYIFHCPSKNKWEERKHAPFYRENNLDSWCIALDKDITEKRKAKIIQSFKKQKEYSLLGEYLYYEVEYADVVKWQTDIFRKAFKEAANTCEIEYNVSCHSLRKTFGYWSKMIHPSDPNALETLQSIYNHTDTTTTMHYIGLSEKRKRKYFDDFGEMISQVESGNANITIDNSPVISLKNEDLRSLLRLIITDVRENKNDIDVFNSAMDFCDQYRIANL